MTSEAKGSRWGACLGLLLSALLVLWHFLRGRGKGSKDGRNCVSFEYILDSTASLILSVALKFWRVIGGVDPTSSKFW